VPWGPLHLWRPEQGMRAQCRAGSGVRCLLVPGRRGGSPTSHNFAPLVRAGIVDLSGLTDWSAADIRALPYVGALRCARLVTAIRDAGVYLPDNGYPRDLPSALRSH
jgi:hypothetical protein